MDPFLLASGGLLLTSLAAPWGYADGGTALTTAGATASGWEWLDAGPRAVLVATALATVGLGMRRPRRGLTRVALTVAIVAVAVVVVIGLGDKRIPTAQLWRSVEPMQFSATLDGGPALTLTALALLAAALAGVRARADAGARTVALLAAGALLAGSTFLRWSWTESDDRADAWYLYEWADVGLVLIAAAIAVAASVPPRRALLLIPLVALVLPFLDRGVDPSGPGGFHEPLARAGSPVGLGVLFAVVALLLAAALGMPLRKKGG